MEVRHTMAKRWEAYDAGARSDANAFLDRLDRLVVRLRKEFALRREAEDE